MRGRQWSLRNEPKAPAEVRDHAASLLVTALAAAFGVGLIQATAILDDVIGYETGGTIGTALFSVAAVFIGLSMYVASIVTANTFSTVVAGRTATIALLRLIGASAKQLRDSVAREGVLVGVVGAALGLVIGIAGTWAARALAVSTGQLPRIDYTVVHPLVLLPTGAVILTTWIAARVGSRRVLAVTPMQATGTTVETPETAARRPVRTALSIIAVGGGFVLLGLGVLLGMLSPTGIVVAFFGGLVSFTGIVLGARSIMPVALSAVGKMFGSSASARLAAANAVRYPERSTRTTIGLVIGVTLVVTLAVASASYASIMRSQPGSEDIERALTVTTAVLGGLVGFSAVIAAVGMVSNTMLSVLQRTRELVLLRALGFTRKQLRSTILFESAQMVVAAVGLGLALGTVYGWAAAQSLLGSIGDTGLALPTLPWGLVAGTVLAAAVLALVASLTPARRAGRLSPAAVTSVA